MVIRKFFIDTLKKISQKNRKFQWFIINSKKSKIFENLTIYIDSTDINHWWKFQVFSVISFWITTIKKNRFGRKLVLRKNSHFSVIFFLFFSIFLKTVGKCLLLTSITHQGYSLLHWKPPPKFEIEALFRLNMLYTDTKKKKRASGFRSAVH